MAVQDLARNFFLHPSALQQLLTCFPEGLVCFDLETTGLSPLTNHIVEIAALRLHPDGFIHTFESLVRPPHPIPPHTTAIHHITDLMVLNSPTISELLPAFFQFIGDRPLFAHNAKFDIGLLIVAAHRQQLALAANPVYCTLSLARKARLSVANFRLQTLCEHFQLSPNTLHRALEDSWAILQILGKLLSAAPPASVICNLRDFDPSPDFQLPPHLQLIDTAITRQQSLEILYQGGSRRGIFRPIRPIGLLPLPQGNVLYATCLLDQQPKSFSLGKIKEVRYSTAEEDGAP